MVRLKRQTQRYVMIDLALILVTILLAAMGLMVGIPQFVVFVTAGWFVGLLMLMLGLYYVTLTQAHKSFTLVTSDDVWAHWTYHTNEWRAITDNAAVKHQLTHQASHWMPILMNTARLYGYAAFALVFVLFLQTIIFALFGGLLVGVGTFLVFYRSATRVAFHHAIPYPTANESTTDVYIGKHGLVFPGSFILFSQPGLALANIHIQGDQPGILQIHFIHHFAKQEIPFTLLLPIPRDHEHEAVVLRQRIWLERAQPTRSAA